MYIIYNLVTGNIAHTIQTSKPIDKMMSDDEGYIISEQRKVSGYKVDINTLELVEVESIQHPTHLPKHTTMDFSGWFDENITSSDDVKKLIKIYFNSLHHTSQEYIMQEFDK